MKRIIFGNLLVALATSLIWIEFYEEKAKANELNVRIVEVEKVVEKEINKDLLVEAFIQVESEGKSDAVNKKTKATGVLQLMPIMIKQANKIVGFDKYKLDDRKNRKKSVEIFHTIMGSMNPTYDIHLAAKIWNPRCKLSYHTAIESKYNELLNNK